MCSGLSLVRHALTAVWCCSGAAVSGEDRAVPAAVGREPAPRLPPLARHPHHREPHLRGRGVLDAPRAAPHRAPHARRNRNRTRRSLTRAVTHWSYTFAV